MAGVGYTPDQIDAMPMQDALAVLRYWRDHPPTHEILAAAYGLQPSRQPDANDPSNIGALIARHPKGSVRR